MIKRTQKTTPKRPAKAQFCSKENLTHLGFSKQLCFFVFFSDFPIFSREKENPSSASTA
jgi:hypothetical protein